MTQHVLIHDFETRSALDLEDVGAWRYACDPTTEVLCCAYGVDDGPIKLWVPGDPVPPEFVEAARNPDWISSAFNDNFERLITQHIMVPRHGWPLIPIERRRCSQAAALALALPAKLKSAAQALGLKHQKDEAGRRVMLRLARGEEPRPGDLDTLYAYCRQDVEVERDLHQHIEGLIPTEQALWTLDATINARGIYIDGKLLDAAIKIVETAEQAINTELRTITEGALESIHQTAKLVEWLASQGCVVADVQKTTLQKALTRKNLTPPVQRVIELRLDGAHAAAAKLSKMHGWRNADGRVRGVFRYHGASTGRWTSLGIQLHNMKRPLVEDMGAAIEAVGTGSFEHLRQCYPQPMSVVGDISRALICAAPGHRLIAADLSGIESRVTAWISNQQSKLDQWAKFDRTKDPEDEPYYVVGKTLGVAPAKARTIGKTADLAFGYMGGVGAWKKLAGEDDTSTEDEIKQRQQAWRRAHPDTAKFWGRLNRAAIQAVRKPGSPIECGRVTFAYDGTFLYMQLPSGRFLTYPFPRLRTDEQGNLAVVFMDNAGGKWTACRYGHGAYGGTWIENAVQAVARDLFAAAMPRLEAAGYPIVLHVHDEIVAEVPNGFGSNEEFLKLLTTVPGWADGLPIAAKVRSGPRFCKLQDKPKTEPPRPADTEPPQNTSPRKTEATMPEPKAQEPAQDNVVPIKAMAKPQTFNGDLDQLPAALEHLRAQRVWLVWRWEKKQTKDGAKWTKPPYRAGNPDVHAETNNPKTWGTHAQAVKQVRDGRADGIGFALKGRDIGAVDLDHCRDPETGVIDPWAQKYLDQFPSAYIEATVSGKGLRIIGHSAKQDFAPKFKLPNNGAGIEFFSNSHHYLTLSCNALRVCSELPDIDDRMTEIASQLGYARSTNTPLPGGDADASAAGASAWGKADDWSEPWSLAADERLRSALAAIPTDETVLTQAGHNPRDLWIRFGRALHRLDWGEHGFAIWRDWSALNKTEFDEKGLRTQWASFARGRDRREHPVTIGTIFYYAKLFGWGAQEQHPEPQAPTTEDNGLGEWDAGEVSDDNVPPREWLLGNIFCLSFVSSLLGDGGVGKTATRVAQLLSLAVGRDLTGEHVFRRCRVLILSLEDDTKELKRRIRAARLHHGVEQGDLKGWLFLAAPGRSAGKLLTIDKNGKLSTAGLSERIERVIQKRKIDIVSLDPFVKSHAVGENDNNAIDAVVEILTALAAKHNVAVDIPHHISKGQADPGNANRGRGASAMKDAARLVYTLTTMSPEEAKAFGIEEDQRRSLIRMDSGKVNIAPLGKAK